MRKQRSKIEMAEPLRYWRAKKGLSQLKLAKMADTSALTIGQLESGKRRCRGKTMEKILNGLKLSEEEFFGMRDEGMVRAAAPAVAKPVETITPVTVRKEATSLRLSNLDLELLNRILNLDFDAKLETLKYLQNLS